MTLDPLDDSNGRHDVSELVRMYRGHAKPVEMGRAFLSYRERHGLSGQALARLTGLTPGVIHHLESLLSLAPELIAAVECGRLVFKEGRALADLPTHDRQIEIARLFLDGWLSSVQVEAAVQAARAKPTATCAEVLDMVIAKAKVKPGQRTLSKSTLRAVPVSADEIQRRMLDLAALLTPIAARPYCEIDTMHLRQTARILLDRLWAARLTGPD